MVTGTMLIGGAVNGDKPLAGGKPRMRRIRFMNSFSNDSTGRKSRCLSALNGAGKTILCEPSLETSRSKIGLLECQVIDSHKTPRDAILLRKNGRGDEGSNSPLSAWEFYSSL